MNDNWFDLVKPTSLDEILNNKKQIDEICNLIENNCKSIIIKGNIGIGKCLIVKLIAQKYNYNFCKYKLNNKKKISIDDYYNVLKKKTIVAIKNLDYITTLNEKKYIMNILKKNNNNKKKIIIFYFVEKTITKLIKEIQKKSVLILLDKPNNSIMLNIIKKILLKKQINICKENYDIIINDIINLSQYDYNRCILLLKDIKYTFNNDLITLDQFHNFKKYTSYKFINNNIFDITTDILNNNNYLKSKIYYNSEKVILPLMIYENYLNKLSICDIDNYKLIEIIKNISNLLSKGDIIETNIYTDQNWYLQDIHGFITTTTTSYLINKYKILNNKKIKINHSSDLNKTSLKNINKKNYITINTSLLNKSVNEILYINVILKNYLNNNSLDKIVEFIKDKKITFRIFEILIKVNKFYKINLINSNKKYIISKLKNS